MDAKIGYRPSYAWRSILFGRELLERGVMKSVGDGRNTMMWMDKWVFDKKPRRPFNKGMTIDLNLWVASLITTAGDWNVTLLQELFPPCEVTRIRSFPPVSSLPDKFMWAYTTDGKYSVKSGNWLLSKETMNANPLSENTIATNKIKERIWDTSAEPKIKIFLWRILSGAIAVAENLRKHGVQVNPLCSICKTEEETTTHVLFGCILANQIWYATSLPLPRQGFSSGVLENIEYVLRLMDKVELVHSMWTATPWILWGIWKARNGSVFANSRQDQHMVIATALEESEVWCFQQQNLAQNTFENNRREGKLSQIWTRPSAGSLKCNIHCSWVNEDSCCGGAWLLRNQDGNAIVHARDAFLQRQNCIMAELHCILWCLTSLHDLHFSSVEIWSDCQAAVHALRSPLDWPKYRSQLEKINRVVQVMGEVSFNLSSPKANVLARNIARSVTKYGRFTSYSAMGGPAWLHERIERERCSRV